MIDDYKQFISRFSNHLKNRVKEFSVWIKKVYHAIYALLSYMASQVRKNMPSWRQDVEVYRAEKRVSWANLKSNVKTQYEDWKATFANLDASPEKLHEMLFDDRSKIGKRFEEVLILLILASVLVVMLDSVNHIHARFGILLGLLEWIFTIIFTVEYLLRIYSSAHPIKYVTSFFGVIDLVTVLPTYIGIFVPGAHTFLVLRILRVFRIFRLLRLVNMTRAGSTIVKALDASKEKIIIFMIFVLLLVVLMGSVLYLVEAGADSGFTSIPRSVYWAIITLTTVGYGDIAPATWLGQLIAAMVMIIGYSVIAVPTGIVSAEFVKENKKTKIDKVECQRCGKEEHEPSSRFCNRCGEKMKDEKSNI
jgi:voltage-gated potassium channel